MTTWNAHLRAIGLCFNLAPLAATALITLAQDAQAKRGSSGGSSSSASESKATNKPTRHFRNCAEARAAGVAPVRRGEPGYAPHLDRDRDGIACEPYRKRR